MTVSKLYIEARRHALEERCARTRTRSGRAKTSRPVWSAIIRPKYRSNWNVTELFYGVSTSRVENERQQASIRLTAKCHVSSRIGSVKVR